MNRQNNNLQHGFFFLLLLLATLAFLNIIEGLLQPIFWAAVLAIIFRPMMREWKETLGNRQSLAAVLTLITIILIVIIPLFLVGFALSNEVIAIYGDFTSGRINLQEPLDFIERSLPIIAEYMDRFGLDTTRMQEGLSGAAMTVSQFLATKALAFGQNALRIGALFFIMLYLLFFFLRDGDKIVDIFIQVLPLGNERERRLFGKFAEVSRATIKGTLVVGVVQGGLGALIFWILGISAPIFWGVLMAILSLLPAVGAAIIWFPAAIILLVTGSIIKGIILIVFGVVVISLVDNLLRPILVGRDTKLPDYLILLATLGGLTVFGISGFVIGPIIAALFVVVWEMFREDYASGVDPEEIKEALRHPRKHEIDTSVYTESEDDHPEASEE